MEITREQLINRVAKSADYFYRDVRNVFNALEDVLVECFEDIDDDEPIMVKIAHGLCLSGYIVPERERVNPRDRTPIICAPTVKINAKVTDGFKKKIQKIYDDKKAE